MFTNKDHLSDESESKISVGFLIFLFFSLLFVAYSLFGFFKFANESTEFNNLNKKIRFLENSPFQSTSPIKVDGIFSHNYLIQKFEGTIFLTSVTGDISSKMCVYVMKDSLSVKDSVHYCNRNPSNYLVIGDYLK